MSIGHNLAATTVSRVVLTAVALLVLPVYLHLLGQEAYGLVTLFLVLQVWFQLLDFGLTPTLTREVARRRADANAAPDLRRLLQALERLFIVAATLAGFVLLALAGPVAEHWLNPEHLLPVTVVDSLRLMALCIALRLLGDLYRGAISGFEQLVWLAGSTGVFGVLRLVGVIPFLWWAGPNPVHFFGFQLACNLVETVVVRSRAWRAMPAAVGVECRWSLEPIRKLIGFALTMSLASALWVITSQTDKLVLSGLLSLSAFGAYGLAVTAAGGVLILAAALADTLTPRLIALQAGDARAELLALYRTATQWAGMVAWSAAGLLAFHAEHVLWAWTGDADLARSSAGVLSLYALGNAALAIAAYPYYLQLARGQLRLHLFGTGLMLVLLLPSVVWATARHGAVGAAAVWLVVNALYLLIWTPIAHARFAPGLHRRWLLSDVVPVATFALGAAGVTAALPWPAERPATALLLLPTAAVILLAAAAGSGWARACFRRRCSAFIA